MTTAAANTAPLPRSLGLWALRFLLYGSLLGGLLLGGMAVKLLSGCALAFALWGDWDGAFRHVARYLVFGFAVWLAIRFASDLGNIFVSTFNCPPVVGALIGCAVMVVGLTVFVGWFIKGLARRIHRTRFIGPADRAAGLLVGGAEGGLLAVAAIWCSGLLFNVSPTARAADTARPVVSNLQQFRADLESDPVGHWLHDHNPLTRYEVGARVQQMTRILSDQTRFEAFAEDPRVRRLAENEALQQHLEALRSDPALREACRQRDLATLVQAPQFRAMLTDRELQTALRAQWRDLAAAVETHGALRTAQALPR